LHDIGKVGVSTNILDKPGQLTRTELERIEEHPQKGARILEPLTMYAPVVPIVLQHHERLNGTGYPNHLLGEAICSGARILAVADVYDALVSLRPYRTPWNRQRAMAFVQSRANSLFDSRVVEAFLDIMTSADPEDGGPDIDMAEILLDVTPSNGSFCLLRKQGDS
jgi:HD-GYP domain-containing protein (c-di-GMP phosphodiesterase class II)